MATEVQTSGSIPAKYGSAYGNSVTWYTDWFVAPDNTVLTYVTFQNPYTTDDYLDYIELWASKDGGVTATRLYINGTNRTSRYTFNIDVDELQDYTSFRFRCRFYDAATSSYVQNGYDGSWTATWLQLAVPPTISTLDATNIGTQSSEVGGTVDALDPSSTGASLKVYYGLTDGGTDTTAWDNNIELGNTNTTGTFIENLTGLSLGTKYYYIFYAEDNGGIAWGTTKSFTTLNKAVKPTASDVTNNSVILTSDEGSTIICNGIGKPSGSTWDNLASDTLYSAYAFFDPSVVSDLLFVKTLQGSVAIRTRTLKAQVLNLEQIKLEGMIDAGLEHITEKGFYIQNYGKHTSTDTTARFTKTVDRSTLLYAKGEILTYWAYATDGVNEVVGETYTIQAPIDPPLVNSLSASRVRMSQQTGKETSLVTIEFDKPTTGYTVNVLGTAPTTGTVAESEYKNIGNYKLDTVQNSQSKSVSEVRQIDSNVPITAEIDFTELYQEGENKVNVYGKSIDNIWSEYHVGINNASISAPHQTYLNISDNVTIQIDVMLKEYGSYYSDAPMMKYGGTADANFRLYLFGHYDGKYVGNQGQVRFYANAGGSWKSISGGHQLELYKWHTVTLTYNSVDGGQLYIDGVPQGVRTGSGLLATNTHNLSFSHTMGVIRRGMIWSKELTQGEIDYYRVKNPKGTENNLVAFYPMDEGSGTTINDKANSNNGNLNRGNWE